jgi:oligo-1,6-glucosidase
MLATYLATLSGTPFLLAGQEIGMANLGPEYGPEAYIDVEAKNHYNAVLQSRGGDESQMSDVLREMQLKARDHGRLPMQWKNAPNAGFTTPDAKPWMTINQDFVDWNVESQIDDPDSVLSHWKKMLALRKENPDLWVYGSYESLPESETGEDVIIYKRMSRQSSAIVLLNFSDKPQQVSGDEYSEHSVLISNQPDAGAVGGQISLAPYGAVVLVDS